MKDPERKYKDGDKVIVSYQNYRMVVADAELCLGGWRYKLFFPKKDGTMDMRKGYRFFSEDRLLSA